ncbi:hypothetical protein BGZ76_002945 [Entomortierella beljakovae]|nr:hypothetical protein BGZ76_002945 [Entomortierella beljakovae]
MHSLAECPLRTFCCIITTNQHPFHIQYIDNVTLDYFINIDSSLNKDTLTSAEINSLSELRASTRKNLIGNPIHNVISPSSDSSQKLSSASLQDDNNICTLQTFKVSESLFCNGGKRIILDKGHGTTRSKQTPRRLHGCIHTSTYSSPYSLSGNHTTALTPTTQSISLQSHSEQQDDQCRVYVLKDVTDIHNLAMAVKDGLCQRRSRFPRSIIATHHHRSSVMSYSDVPCTSVTFQKPYSVESIPDWSMTTSHQQSSSSMVVPSTSPLHPLITSDSDPTESKKSEDMGLLLLQITAFGTIDHAFVMHQHPYHHNSGGHSKRSFFAIDDDSISAMTNRSIMYYTHSDDIPTLCRELNQISNSANSTFYIRWCLDDKVHMDEHNDTGSTIPEEEEEEKEEDEQIQQSHSREIVYKGEVYEEWTDPTAITPEPSSPITKTQSRESKNQSKFIWTEVKATRSIGQPILVIRPLTAKEIQSKNSSQPLQASSIPSSQPPHRRTRHTRNQCSGEWRHRAKRMGLEEGMIPPKQMSLSALTSIADPSLRMPGSFPYNLPLSLHQLQIQTPQMSHSTAVCYSRPTTGMISMPSVLAYPQTTNQSWTVFANVALDAWKQWIQAVHAGQAQFQDWCEYVLETTIDQLIESVSIGLTLLDIENGPIGSQLEDEKKSAAITKITQNTSRHQRQLSMGPRDGCSTSSKNRQKQKLTGSMHRVGQILHKYPNVEGAVRTFGNSWLGRRIKTRLEHKILDKAADQVVEWWFNNDAGQTNNSSPDDSPNTLDMNTLSKNSIAASA